MSTDGPTVQEVNYLNSVLAGTQNQPDANSGYQGGGYAQQAYVAPQPSVRDAIASAMMQSARLGALSSSGRIMGQGTAAARQRAMAGAGAGGGTGTGDYQAYVDYMRGQGGADQGGQWIWSPGGLSGSVTDSPGIGTWRWVGEGGSGMGAGDDGGDGGSVGGGGGGAVGGGGGGGGGGGPGPSPGPGPGPGPGPAPGGGFSNAGTISSSPAATGAVGTFGAQSGNVGTQDGMFGAPASGVVGPGSSAANDAGFSANW